MNNQPPSGALLTQRAPSLANIATRGILLRLENRVEENGEIPLFCEWERRSEFKEKVEHTRARMVPNQMSTRSLRPNANSFLKKKKRKEERKERRESRDEKGEGMGDPAHGPPPCPVPSSLYLPRRSCSTVKPGSNHFLQVSQRLMSWL